MNTTRSKDGTLIAFERSGHGPALILVDGALCYRASGPAARLPRSSRSASPWTGTTAGAAATAVTPGLMPSNAKSKTSMR